MVEIGEYIKRKREEKGLSLREVSRELGEYASMLSRLEQGQVQEPRFSLIVGLVDVVGLDIMELVKIVRKERGNRHV